MKQQKQKQESESIPKPQRSYERAKPEAETIDGDLNEQPTTPVDAPKPSHPPQADHNDRGHQPPSDPGRKPQKPM